MDSMEITKMAILAMRVAIISHWTAKSLLKVRMANLV